MGVFEIFGNIHRVDDQTVQNGGPQVWCQVTGETGEIKDRLITTGIPQF